MSKWRPSENNLYVIGDIHGNYDCLRLILNRITPLRKGDEIVFLGDYIDRGPDSAKVIDKLCRINNKYENITCLSGNHEWLMKASVGLTHPLTSPLALTPEQIWLSNGGIPTILSYAKMKGLNRQDAMSIPLTRYKGIMPEEHKDFLLGLYSFYETDDYIFVHAGCDPNLPVEVQPDDILLWDRSLWRFVRTNYQKGNDFDWDKIIVCGHNYKGPFIHPKYMMLDVSGDNGKVMCAELNSMTAYIAEPGKQRMVSISLEKGWHW